MPAFCDKLLGTYNKAAELQAVIMSTKEQISDKTVTKRELPRSLFRYNIQRGKRSLIIKQDKW